jgi:transcriptional regulator with XRE-family HTH domain
MATESLAAMVRRLRKEADLSQQALARAAGISRPWLARIEKGEGHPSTKVVLDIARALDVPAEPLMHAAGRLGPRDHFPEPTHDPILRAIHRAKWMTGRDKELLVALYRRCFGPRRR